MFTSLKELFFLLNPKQRKNLYLLQILIILMSFLEVASVLIIGPFVAFIGNTEILLENNIISLIFIFLNFQNPNSFLIFLSASVLFVMILTAIISIITLWCLSMYGAKVGADLSNRLYKYYIYKP